MRKSSAENATTLADLNAAKEERTELRIQNEEFDKELQSTRQKLDEANKMIYEIQRSLTEREMDVFKKDQVIQELIQGGASAGGAVLPGSGVTTAGGTSGMSSSESAEAVAASVGSLSEWTGLYWKEGGRTVF